MAIRLTATLLRLNFRVWIDTLQTRQVDSLVFWVFIYHKICARDCVVAGDNSHHQIQINAARDEIVFTPPLVHQPWLDDLPLQLLEEPVCLFSLYARHAPFRPAFQHLVLEHRVSVQQKEEKHSQTDDGSTLRKENASAATHQPARTRPHLHAAFPGPLRTEALG